MLVRNAFTAHLVADHADKFVHDISGGIDGANLSIFEAYHGTFGCSWGLPEGTDGRCLTGNRNLRYYRLARPEEGTVQVNPEFGVYAGPTLLEALWDEMDRLMEGLMTKQDAADGGDRFRAEELGYVIAVVSNPYQPDINAIRKEALRRFREGTE